MYVLIDMEWVTNRHGNHWPTQLAAIRVDEEWQTVDSFSVLFRPKDITFQKWDHMAFSGWTRDNFLNADSLYPALDAFEHWLQPEDILCWWHQEAYDLYIMFTKVAQIRDRASMEHFKLELLEYLDYYNNRRIKAKLKGLPPAIHRQQALSAA